MDSPNEDRDWRKAYDADGFVVLEGLLNETALEEIRERLAELLRKGPWGRNDFEGTRTRRIYTLVGRGETFERLAEHPVILSMLDELLLP
ncbi:MAG: hypothetical protein OEV36_13020, partial [Myxococcales bacterium]|nr:hypothetical protein [Myxococcales bacterium]